MGVFKLKREQVVKASLEEVWDFFSNPNNLAKITPDNMGFKVTSEPFNGKIYPGQIITYTVSPVLNIPMFWMTEITHVVDNEFFVDEQRVGPYKIWHHEHHFMEENGHVLMTDIVHYQPPLGIIGNAMNSLFIKRKLDSIFEYRKHIVDQTFNS